MNEAASPCYASPRVDFQGVAGMPRDQVVRHLKAAIPMLFEIGKVAEVEAVSGALDRLEWAHLALAPRQGETVLVAFAGGGDWPPYAAFAYWVVPEAGQPLNWRQREMLEKHGGWWGSGKRGLPHRSLAIAWLPSPELPTEPPRLDPDALTGCADDQDFYAMEEAA